MAAAALLPLRGIYDAKSAFVFVGRTAGNDFCRTAPQTAVLDVHHMTCSMCSITIRKALEKVPGVLDAKVDYDHKTAVVKYDPDKADSSPLIKATTNAGFPSKLHGGARK